MRPSRLLFVSTPIGTLGSGGGGGVELTLPNAARALGRRGHHVTVLAPAGSTAPGLDVVEVAGRPPPSAQNESRDAPVVVPPGSLVANLFRTAARLAGGYDAIVNFAYDWLGFYLTPFLATPLAHLVSMGSLLDTVDEALGDVVANHPGRAACHTRAQAATFPFGAGLVVIGNGLDLDRYQARLGGGEGVAWVGRIAPEKGLEDAVAAAAAAGEVLRVFGVVADPAYWDEVRRSAPEGVVDHRGFLPTDQLQDELGRCRALLVTPKWEEAFGNVVAEAAACGVPVVAYGRGGPAELVLDGVTGAVVAPAEGVAGLVGGLDRVRGVERAACRAHAEAAFSLDAFADRLEAWLGPLVA